MGSDGKLAAVVTRDNDVVAVQELWSNQARRYFQNIAMGEVSKSAEQARDMGYLRPSDRIVMNRF